VFAKDHQEGLLLVREAAWGCQGLQLKKLIVVNSSQTMVELVKRRMN
jgi:hypothetical protein